tara:strand:- start:945 stop:1160 length:216 start_codon:yes stop_codon:yes gene_type:complete
MEDKMQNTLLFFLGLFVGLVFQQDLPIIKHIDHKSIRDSILGTPDDEPEEEINVGFEIGDMFQIKCTGGEK